MAVCAPEAPFIVITPDPDFLRLRVPAAPSLIRPLKVVLAPFRPAYTFEVVLAWELFNVPAPLTEAMYWSAPFEENVPPAWISIAENQEVADAAPALSVPALTTVGPR